MANAEAPPTVAAEKPRRVWRKRLIKIAAVLLVVLLLAPFALSLGPVKNMVASAVGETLGRDVTIDSAFAYWFHGIDLEGVTVASPAGYDGPLATVKKVHADVGIFGLLTGSLDAEVAVDSPHVTLRRSEGGRGSNLDGLAEALGGEKHEKSDGGGSASIRLNLTNGIVEAEAVGGGAPTRVEALNITAFLDAEGAMGVTFEGRAKDAKAGGGDAEIKLGVQGPANGIATWNVLTPRIDLGRLSALLGSLGPLAAISGELDITGEGEGLSTVDIKGNVLINGARINARFDDGATLVLEALTARLTGGNTEGEATFAVDVDLTTVDYTQPTATATLRFSEALVTIDGEGALQRDSDRVIVRTAVIGAGETLRAEATKPWMVAFGDKVTAQGQATIKADFARLGSLRSLSPQLTRLTSGNLVANVNARQGDGFDASIGARVMNLSVASPLPGGRPYREPDLIVQARYGKVGAAQRIDLYRLTSTLATSNGASAKTPLVIHIKPGNLILNGPVGLRLNLNALSLLAPEQLSLEAGETIDGLIEMRGAAQGTESKSTVNVQVTGLGVRLPTRWDLRRTPGNIEATLRADMTPEDLKLVLTRLQGFGLTEGSGTIRLLTKDERVRVGDSTLKLGLNMAVARPWLLPFMGLEPQARFAGEITASVNTVERDEGLVLKGTSNARNVFWQPTPEDVPLRDTQISVSHDVWLAPQGGRSTIAKLALAMTGLTVDITSSSFAMIEGDVDVDAQGTLRGDAARLAPTVASLLGPDYADMRGAGPIQGTFKATGSPGRGGEDLLLDLTVAAGSWSSGGLSIANTQVTARRAALEDPISAAVNATFNKGPTTVSGTYAPGPKRTPWTMALNASRVDTSSLLVDRGPARFLAFALPATLPSNAKVPVLSGLLDARVNLQSDDLADPAMLDGLRGNGQIQMQEGEIKNSTLFSSGKGGRLGQALTALSVAVPEVGQVVKSVSRALTFQSLDSMFTIGSRRVNVQQTKLAGRYVTLLTKGVVTFKQQVNLTTDLTFEGSAGKGVEKYLPDRTIPLRITGTLPDTKVTPNIDLSKLAGSGLLDRAKGLLDGKKPKDIVKDLKDLIK